jgi:hypothetical protein
VTLYQEFIDCRKGYHSFTKKVSSNILIEFGVTMKLVMLVRMCLKEVWIDQDLSDTVSVWSSLK